MLGDEIKEELHAIVTSEEHRDWLVPRESFERLVNCASIPVTRRIAILVLGLSGLRPGELAGLQFRHLVQRGDACLFSIEQQWTLKRGRTVPAGAATPKTRWAKRMVPLHPALHRPLAQWVTSGWRVLVGREPTLDDFVFPGPDGAPFREEKGTVFREDLARAGCPTDYEGVPLRPYALRHLFSTMLAEDGANGAAHDRLLGHRPADTKSLNYTAKLASFLDAELRRIKFELPADAPSFGAP
jgi:integrase